MMESTFFYTGLIAFSMMIIGLSLTVFEFRRQNQSLKAAKSRAKTIVPEPEVRFAYDDKSRLKSVNTGDL